jgi:hypothetical protein
LEIARNIINDIGGHEPSSILEVGCSVGFKCLAFDELFAERIIFGIEPDMDAIQVGMAMAEGLGAKKTTVVKRTQLIDLSVRRGPRGLPVRVWYHEVKKAPTAWEPHGIDGKARRWTYILKGLIVLHAIKHWQSDTTSTGGSFDSISTWKWWAIF